MKIEIKREYWPNGNLCLELSHLNSFQNGEQKIYYQNGNIKSKWYCENALQHGLSFWWNEEGGLIDIRKRKQGSNHGPRIIFDDIDKFELYFQ